MGLIRQLIYGDEEEIIDINKQRVMKLMKTRSEMTGWERVKSIFRRDEVGEISPELTVIKESMVGAFFLGAIIGGINYGKQDANEHLRSNTHTAFQTPLQAKRALTDRVFLGFGAGAVKVGWRFAVFTGCYMTTVTLVSTYRDKIGLIDPMTGGAVAGLLYKFKDGPKPAFAGSLIGGSLGLLGGCFIVGLMKLSGIDFRELSNYQHQRIYYAEELPAINEPNKTIEKSQIESAKANLLKSE